jgi:hypothetical protein
MAEVKTQFGIARNEFVAQVVWRNPERGRNSMRRCTYTDVGR